MINLSVRTEEKNTHPKNVKLVMVPCLQTYDVGAGALRQKNGKFDPDSEATKIYVTPKGSRKRIKLKVVMRKELKVRAEMSETQARKQKNQQTKTWIF